MGETPSDELAAETIRGETALLRGIIHLGDRLRVPEVLRHEVTDQQWLDGRLKGVQGLARHNVLAAMRSSRAALVEHLAGTAEALRACGLPATAKKQATGDVVQNVTAITERGLPQSDLACTLPEWLTEEAAWRQACAEETATYQRILEQASKFSDAREQTKADLLARLAVGRRLVLAFDRHPITLAAIWAKVRASAVQVLIASGETPKSRKRIRDALDPVRRLIEGEDALVPHAIYAEHRHTRQRVMARVAPVAADAAWAFLALAGTQHGAPRWLMLEGDPLRAAAGVEAVAERLWAHLRADPPNVPFDENCERWLDKFLSVAAQNESMLLPRRMQRALEQMAQMTGEWGNQAFNLGDQDAAERWWRLRKIARPAPDDEEQLDPYLVREAWWDLVRPSVRRDPAHPTPSPLHPTA